MPLDATLLELLACPSDDHAALAEQERDGVAVLVCSYCASSFPIEDGIPVLLLDEASPGPNGIGVAATPRPKATARVPATADHEAQHAYPPVDAVVEPASAAPAPVDEAPAPVDEAPAPVAEAQLASGADVELPVGAEPVSEPALPEAVADAEPQAVSAVEPQVEAVSDPEPEHDHLDLERPMVPAVATPPTDAPRVTTPQPAPPRRPTPVSPALQQVRTRANQLRRLVQDRVEEHIERGPDGRPRLKRRGPDS